MHALMKMIDEEHRRSVMSHAMMDGAAARGRLRRADQQGWSYLEPSITFTVDSSRTLLL